MPALKGSLYFYLTIAVVQALVVLALVDLEHPALVAAVISLVLVVGANLQLLGEQAGQRRTWLGILGLGLLFAAVSAWVFGYTGADIPADSRLAGCWIMSALAAGYIATALIQASPGQQGYLPPYEVLFRHAWNNGFIVLLALLLTGLFWLLLWLCSHLFSMLGIDAFDRLFSSSEFIIFSLALLFSLGMRMGRENAQVIALLRGVLLTLCRFLMPLAALIVLLFTATLPFTGLATIWQTGYSTPILLCMVAVSIFLINGVFQDGLQPTGYPRAMVALINLSLLCLPILAALAAYSTWLRIDQYGLTPQRFSAMTLVILSMFYSLAVAGAVILRHNTWLGSLRTTNPWLAMLTFAILVATNTPWLNPLELSARNQIARLLDGRTAVADFDANALRNGTGEIGRHHYQALLEKIAREQLFDKTSRDLLLADEPTADWERYRQRPKNLTWIGPPVEGSEQFAEQDVGEMPCDGVGCVLWAVDLNDDGQPEVLEISKKDSVYPIYFFTRSAEGKWTQAGLVNGMRNTFQVIELIEKGEGKVMKPAFNNLEFGGVRFTPQPTEKP